MPEELEGISVSLGLEADEFSRGLNKAFASLDKFANNLKKIGKDIRQVGQTLSFAITAPLTAFAVKALSSASGSKILAGSIATLGEKFDTMANIVGTILAPVVEGLIKLLIDAIDEFNNLDSQAQINMVSMGALAGSIGPVLYGLGSAIVFAGSLITAMNQLYKVLRVVAGFLTTVFSAALIAVTGVSLAQFVAYIKFAVIPAVALFLLKIGLLIGVFDLVVDVVTEVQLTFAELIGMLMEHLPAATDFIMTGLIMLVKGYRELARGASFAFNTIAKMSVTKAYIEAEKSVEGLDRTIAELTENSGKYSQAITDDIQGIAKAIKDKLELDAKTARAVWDETLNYIPNKIKAMTDSLVGSSEDAIFGFLNLKKIMEQIKELSGSFSSSPVFPSLGGSGLGSLLKMFGKIDISGIFKKIKTGLDELKSNANIESKWVVDTASMERVKETMREWKDEQAKLWREGLTGWAEYTQSISEMWEEMGGSVKETMHDLAQVTMDTWQSLRDGFGDAVSEVLVDGASALQVIKDLAKSVLKELISALVSLATQYIATSLVATTAGKTSALSQVMSYAAVAGAAAYSAIAGIPLVGPFLAPAAGATAYAGAAAYGATLALAKGGIVTGKTNAIIGEGGEPEAVIPLSKLAGFGQSEKSQRIIIELDGRTLAQQVIKNMPSEVRMRAGIRAL